MRWSWINPTLLALVIATLAGCATSKDKLLARGEQTMQNIWQHADTGGQMATRQLLDARP